MKVGFGNIQEQKRVMWIGQHFKQATKNTKILGHYQCISNKSNCINNLNTLHLNTLHRLVIIFFSFLASATRKSLLRRKYWPMARSWHSIVVAKTTLLLPGVVRLGALGIRLHAWLRLRLRFGFAH